LLVKGVNDPTLTRVKLQFDWFIYHTIIKK